jgi:hypothetical protein
VSTAEPPPHREQNLGLANDLLETEITQRNTRKDAQENSARWIVLTVVALMTLLLTLSGKAGILDQQASWLSRALFLATLGAGALTAACAGGTLWPRKYERLGEGGLDEFNKAQFLDQEPHAVMGRLVATRIQIAKKMDQLHEVKARWLKRALAALAATLALVVAQGVVLAVDPPISTHDSHHPSHQHRPELMHKQEPPQSVRPVSGPTFGGATRRPMRLFPSTL